MHNAKLGGGHYQVFFQMLCLALMLTIEHILGSGGFANIVLSILEWGLCLMVLMLVQM